MFVHQKLIDYYDLDLSEVLGWSLDIMVWFFCSNQAVNSECVTGYIINLPIQVSIAIPRSASGQNYIHNETIQFLNNPVQHSVGGATRSVASSLELTGVAYACDIHR